MYQIIATDNFGTIQFKENVLDKTFAFYLWETARTCADCATADIIDLTTGELIIGWDKYRGVL